MNKFNLTFSGEILPGYDPARAKATLAEILELDDSSQVELFFTGKTVTLVRDLDRKSAAERFSALKKVGVVVALEKIPLDDESTQSDSKPPAQKIEDKPEPAPTPSKPPVNRGMNEEIREENLGRIDQSWPVSRAVEQSSAKTKRTATT
ncbi:MAG: hypothetical protein AB8B81_00510, partial [Halioglobus sp.]